MKLLGVDDKKVCFGVGCGGGAFFIHILSKTLKISVGWVFRNEQKPPPGIKLVVPKVCTT
jgi:hypothetical protein